MSDSGQQTQPERSDSAHQAHADGARRAAHAQLAFKQRRDGFYVLNDETDIPVAGPFDRHGEAAREAFSMQPPAMRVVNLDGGRLVPCR